VKSIGNKSHREYVQKKPSLTYPSLPFLKHAYLEADCILNENISSIYFRKNISALLRKRLNEKLNLDFFQCYIHKEELKQYCNTKNYKTIFIFIL